MKIRKTMRQTVRAAAAAVTALALTAGLILTGGAARKAEAATYYERTRDIPSVRLVIATGNLSVGDTLSDDAMSYVSCVENDYYYIQDAVWLDEIASIHVGDEPRMKVYVAAVPKEVYHTSSTDIYLFRGEYTSSNTRITNGTFISAARRDNGYTLEVTLRIRPVKGQYDAPAYAAWSGEKGTAKWEPSENDSGYYDIYCYRGSVSVKQLRCYKGNVYNFYPYMTKPGTYTFKVRTVRPAGETSTAGQSSEWTESSDLIISETEISDGSGQTTADEQNGSAGVTNVNSNSSYPNGTGNDTVAGWVESGGYRYFRYPSGDLVKDKWLKLTGKWYLFDAQGRMLTGWQNKNNNWYYLDPTSGEMRTGWLYDGGHWYYLNQTQDSFEGCMLKGWLTVGDKKYYMNENGIMVTGWFQIDGKWYYFYPQGSTGNQYGYMARNTDIGGFHIGADGTWENTQ